MLIDKGRKSGLLLFVAAVLVISTLSLGAQAENLPYASARNQLVRVLLTRLNLTNRMDISLSTDYLLTTEEGNRIHFRSGSELAFLLCDGTIYLYYSDMVLDAGERIMLERTADAGGFYLTNFPALYLGNLELCIENSVLRPILTIHVEDYLLGVVPYEMGEGFPTEALKAQAIAARTYALRSQNPDAPYDVVDTTNDQVFRGYVPGNPQSEQAVRQTRGICGFYKGRLALCYYSASNGGQMERVETVWPTEADYGYYAFGEDPYDVENPLSTVRAFEIEKQPIQEKHQAFWRLVTKQLEEFLKEYGLDTEAESVRIDEIIRMNAIKPVDKNNKRMTALQLTMRVSGRTKQKAASVRVIDQDMEEVSLFDLYTAAPLPLQATEVSPSTETPSFVYGPFTPLDEEITIEIPIFPEAEKALNLDISPNYENEIWSVTETQGGFVVESRRYGHGVGMSQRGAQWMAQKYKKSYRDILSFYYPGMKLMRYPEEPASLVLAEEPMLVTPGPAPSPTPRPTLMPVTFVPEEEQYLVAVTEITENSSLNLRAEPSLNAEIVMRLYKGQKLIVIEQAAEEGWVRVRTDVAEGYVMESYLSIAR